MNKIVVLLRIVLTKYRFIIERRKISYIVWYEEVGYCIAWGNDFVHSKDEDLVRIRYASASKEMFELM